VSKNSLSSMYNVKSRFLEYNHPNSSSNPLLKSDNRLNLTNSKDEQILKIVMIYNNRDKIR
jgi:hypothetical protein